MTTLDPKAVLNPSPTTPIRADRALLRKVQSFLLVAFCLFFAVRPLGAQLAVGDRFPTLAEFGLEGKLPETEGRVLLVDFWASWCAPCQASFPALAQLQSEFGRKGVIVLGVSVDQKVEGYTAFLKKYEPSFPTVRDRGQKLVSIVQVPVMPTSYVIGRDGRIRSVHSGYHGKETDRSLRAALNATLTENSLP